LIAGSVSDADRGRAFGLEGVGDNFGAFLGPCAAVCLLAVFHVDMRTLFYLAAIPGAAAVAFVALVHERRDSTAATSKVDADSGPLPRPFWKYVLAIALFSVGNSSNSFLILQTRDAGMSLTDTIWIYAGFNLVAALISYPAGSWSDQIGRTRLLESAFVVFFITYLGFALTRNVFLLGSLFVLYGLYQGMFRAVGKALATDLVPTTSRATGVGWYSATVGLSGLIASTVAGQLWDRVGHPAVFFYGAAAAVIGMVALFALVPRAEKRA
jgi:MFS family permease